MLRVLPAHARIAFLFAVFCAVVAPGPAAGAVPESVLVEGVLRSPGGGPVADGVYKLTFALYGVESAGVAVWSEPVAQISIQGGVFTHVLGSQTPLDAAALAKTPDAWLQVQVDPDPPLPRKRLHSVAFAVRAAVAEAVACSGCISAQHIDSAVLSPYAKSAALAKVATTGAYADLAGKPDLSGVVQAGALAKVATSGKYADIIGTPDLAPYAKTAGLADVALSGAYADLEGLPVLAKVGSACGTGLVVNGIQANGTLLCVAALDPAGLPPDGLDEISNQLLTNQFTDVVASAKTPVDILDNVPTGTDDSIDVPDLGIAQGLTISVDLVNSDTSQLKVVAFDPNNAAYVLWDKGPKATALKATYPTPQKPVSGDLLSWVGKNPKGKWRLQAIDTGFLNNKVDGKINAWSVSVQTLSSKKVAATGLFQANGGFQFQVAQSHPVTCSQALFGYTYANEKDKALYICNGKEFYPVVLTPVGTQDNPGKNCADILKKMPASKDGTYWVNGGSGPALQAYCDMTSNGGGWTLAARMVGGSWCHIDSAAAGAITSPSQSGCAKLSDAMIRSLYSDQFWLSCGASNPHRFGKIDNIANFNTDSATGNKKMTWAETYGGATYSGTDHSCCNFGDHDYHNPSIIYSISKGYNSGNYTADWSGCYNVAEGWHKSGFLYVR